jgi:hypothetical protein
MPLLSTSGADCAQGYGFGVGSSTQLTTYVFPSGTSTWTAPPGVTSLLVASGRGANGSAAQWVSNASVGYSIVSATTAATGGAPLDWSTIYSEALGLQAAANSGGTGERAYSPALYYFRTLDPANDVSSRLTLTYSYTIRGTATVSQFINGQTSGQILYSNGSGGWFVNCDLFEPGTTGNPTQGFGLTFPGGTPSSPIAPTTVFSNVAVTPGVTYTINNFQALQITYLA